MRTLTIFQSSLCGEDRHQLPKKFFNPNSTIWNTGLFDTIFVSYCLQNLIYTTQIFIYFYSLLNSLKIKTQLQLDHSHKEDKMWYHLAYRQPSTNTRYCKQESIKSKTRACRVRLCLSYRNAGAPGHGRVGRDPGAATEAPPELRATQHLSIPSQHLTTLTPTFHPNIHQAHFS